jgi:hypothetical protein
MLTRVTQFTGLTGLPIKSDIFFLGSLIFLIVFFLFHSSSKLDWLGNEIYDLFFYTFYKIITISNKFFFYS